MSGISAMESRIPAKGNADHKGSMAPIPPFAGSAAARPVEGKFNNAIKMEN